MINSHNYTVKQLKDLGDLYELALEENNNDIKHEINQNISELRLITKQNEIKCFLSMRRLSRYIY